jgi:hypothetical protein
VLVSRGLTHVKANARLFLLLGIALLLRTYLIFQGGQYYWPDERLYRVSQTAASFLVAGDVEHAAGALHRPEHVFFMVIGVAPAIVEQWRGANSRIPALFFSVVSVASIWILRNIALAAGATETEAFLAALFLACATTWTYYSRHLLPYDTSMTLALLALLAAVRSATRRARVWVCGALCAVAFLAYSGAWVLVGFVMFVASMSGGMRLREVALRALYTVIAFALPIAALFTASAIAGGNLHSEFLSFARTVVQGSFVEGWRIPFAYLWHAEHGIAVLWLVCTVVALSRAPNLVARANVGVAGVVCIYGLLVLASTVLHMFVVYGRTARQLVPFLCLVAAQQLHRLWIHPKWHKAALAVVALSLVQAGVNMATPLGQVFPEEFKIRTTIAMPSARAEGAVFVFADHIFPRPVPVDLSGISTLASAPHPLQFVPYQYEGFTPEERHVLRTTDITMRLVLR